VIAGYSGFSASCAGAWRGALPGGVAVGVVVAILFDRVNVRTEQIAGKRDG
jgi:hypothetical protein